MIFLRLFFSFFKIGLFSIGGGLATIPFLSELSEKTGWFTHAELADMIAVSESTPGPIGVNMATYVGLKVGRLAAGTAGGIFGCILAPLALTLPSLLVILVIIRILDRFRNSMGVKNAFLGLRPASTALITVAALSVMKSTFLVPGGWSGISTFWTVFDLKCLILGVVLVPFVFKLKCHPIWFLLASAVCGIVFHLAV